MIYNDRLFLVSIVFDFRNHDGIIYKILSNEVKFYGTTKIVRVSREGSTVFRIDVTGLEDWVRIVKGWVHIRG